MSDGAQLEDTTFSSVRTNMSFPVRLISNVVFRAEVAVKEEDGDGAHEGEKSDDGRDPESPSVRV